MSPSLTRPLALLDAWEATPEPVVAPLNERQRLETQLRALCAEQGLTSSDHRIQAAVATFMGEAEAPRGWVGVTDGPVQHDTLTSVPIAPLTTLGWLRPENRETWEAAHQVMAVWRKKRWSLGQTLGWGCLVGGLFGGLLVSSLHLSLPWLPWIIATVTTGPVLGFILNSEGQRPYCERVMARFPWLRDRQTPTALRSLEELSDLLSPATPTLAQVTRWRSHPVTAGWYNLLQQTEVPLLNDDVRHLDAYLSPASSHGDTDSTGVH